MYKLFLNGIQIGNYSSIKKLSTCGFNMDTLRDGVKSVKWDGNSCYIRTYDKHSFRGKVYYV